MIENEEQRQALLELEIPVEDGEVIISRRLSKGADDQQDQWRDCSGFHGQKSRYTADRHPWSA